MIPEQILTLPPSDAYAELKRISKETSDVDTAWYAQWWASDAQVLQGNIQQAIEEYPASSSLRSQLQTERRLSLKIAADIGFDAHDILTLFGPIVTKFGRDHLPFVTEAIESIHSQESSSQLTRTLRKWAETSPQTAYSVYIGANTGFKLGKDSGIIHYIFRDSKHAQTYCHQTIRTAENMVRQEMGIPRVNEGWVSETKLYYEIRTAFPLEDVQHHASPTWLGRQHLDIFLPKRGIGIEYQGLQHDEPVAYFGGVSAFKKQRARDMRKRQLCQRNGVHLIYVRPGYNLEKILDTINSTSPTP